MARITQQTRHILQMKVHEAAEAKRKVIAGEYDALGRKIDERIADSSSKALKEIKKELAQFDGTVNDILAKHGLRFGKRYGTSRYCTYDILTREDGHTVLESSAQSRLECDEKDKDKVKHDELKKKLEDIDKAIDKACTDIEFRISLGAKFNEVVELIDNLKF